MFLLCVLLLAGCASLPPREPALAGCAADLAASDQRLRAAGMIDAQAWRIPGFRYLRANRFLASFAAEVDSPEELSAWVGRLHALALESRRIELQLLYPPTGAGERYQQLSRCGERLLAADLANPARMAALRRRAPVPDAYNDAARVAGGYPLAVPFLKAGIHQWQAQVRAAFAEPVAALPRRGELRVYAPSESSALTAGAIAAWLAQARAASPLGIPDIGAQRLARLARHFAPTWAIDTAGVFDLPGTPQRVDSGLTVDATPLRVYFHAAYTRFDGAVLLQLVYTLWFSQRPQDGIIDSRAGALDGLVWRVTLGRNGRPLVYDSIHPCGCYHLFFPSPRLVRRDGGGLWNPAVTVPQPAPPGPRLALRVASASHYLQRLRPAGVAPPPDAHYHLVPYNALRRQRPRLFNDVGMIAGSERGERWWLWPTGVPSPGAMRQWGHHATAFVGKRQFDDPYLIGRYFQRSP